MKKRLLLYGKKTMRVILVTVWMTAFMLVIWIRPLFVGVVNFLGTACGMLAVGVIVMGALNDTFYSGYVWPLLGASFGAFVITRLFDLFLLFFSPIEDIYFLD